MLTKTLFINRTQERRMLHNHYLFDLFKADCKPANWFHVTSGIRCNDYSSVFYIEN